jgi:hypothetical protein
MTDAGARADFLDMERRWTALARSYEFVASIEDFLIDVHRKDRR